MAVLSNKPVNPSRDIVRALGLGDFFVRVYTAATAFSTKEARPAGRFDHPAGNGRGGK
jgi:phosphoglycolate phosphatase-like HAD superfamily hydrolase